MDKIYLCALPGAGKSTLGKLIQEQFNIPFIDLDLCLGRPCRDLFMELGEKGFRACEGAALERLPKGRFLVALGGGTLNCPDNQQKVKSSGKTIYLEEDPLNVIKRVLKHRTPLYIDPKNPKESFLALAEKRIPLYEAIADLTIPLKGRKAKAILPEIMDGIQQFWNDL
jgi:shikimate kinase